MSPNTGTSRRDRGRTEQGSLVHPSTEGWLRRLEKKGAVNREGGFSKRGLTRAKTKTMREGGTFRRA